ncbi:MAG: glutamate--tRNA ligase, partial [Acidobacteriota bacterium]|nr:glutamate--tRNA ligase [Acidobacteriota bacterium]
YQSQRLDRYREVAAQLLDAGHAYRCFCGVGSNAEVEGAEVEKEAGKAGRKSYPEDAGQTAAAHECALLSPEESARRAAAGEPFAIRFRIPSEKTSSFKDKVFGKIEIENSILEDFVLLRSDGVPTYHLSVVVDDMDMGVTHVIRGADHISNTPKQIFLYRAVGKPVPEFVHLPLILGPDKQRLSKRHGATSVMSYAEEGYQPEAFFNFLSLLGWSPGDDRELLTRDELVSLFSLEGVGKANAVFGTEKLDWFNSQYLRNMPAGELRALAVAELQTSGVWPATGNGESAPTLDPEILASLDAAIELVKPRAKKIADFSGNFRAFFTDDFAYDPAAAAKFLSDAKLHELLPALRAKYDADEVFTLQSTEEALRALAEASGVKAGLLINALRVALTGQGVAPGLFEVMQVLGRRRTLARIKRLSDFLSASGGK